MHAELVKTGDWILLRDLYAGDLEGTPETALLANPHVMLQVWAWPPGP